MKKFGVFLFVLILMLLVDQGVKEWVRLAIPPGGTLSGSKPFPGVFEITLSYNQGIAFGLFQGRANLMTPIALVIALGAAIYSARNRNEGLLTHIAMGLLASGALGNLYDRLFDARGVTDMFYFRLINFPVFNVADACITVATILLIGTWWLEALAQRTKVVKVETPPPAAE